MRTFLFLIATLLLAGVALAQVSDSLILNVDQQPLWGPTGYDHVEYYYLPDINVYYSVSLQRFYYFDGGRWNSCASLPSRYRGYNLYRSFKVVVNEVTPYINSERYNSHYAYYNARHLQEAIRDSHDAKYAVNPHHPQHRYWVNQQKQEKSEHGENLVRK